MTILITKPEKRKGLRTMASPSKETFKGYTVNSKLDTLYDFHIEAIGIMERMCGRVETVETKQRKWKLIRSTTAFIGGTIGGAVAYFSSKFFTGN